MEELGYQPSQAARSLKNQRTRTIGLIVPTIVDEFFSNIATVVQDVCRKNNYLLILSTSLDAEEKELEELELFEQFRLDGLLIVPPKSQSEAFRRFWAQLRIPAVTMDLPANDKLISSILIDNRRAMANATRHLLAHKRRRIALLVSDPVLYTMQQRILGYKDALRQSELEPLIHSNIYQVKDVETALFSPNGRIAVDGVLAANSKMTMLAFEALQKHGIRIPATTALIGFDDFALAPVLRPSISNVRQPAQEIGRAAIELLFDLMSGTKAAPVHCRIASELVSRASCGCSAE
jgi:LacI family transcriptional regulator